MNSYWLSTSVLVQHITCVIQNCRDCLQVAWAKETVCENSENFGYGKANPWLPTRLGNMSRRKLRESKILLRGAMLGGAWSQCLVEPELVELTGLFLVGRLIAQRSLLSRVCTLTDEGDWIGFVPSGWSSFAILPWSSLQDLMLLLHPQDVVLLCWEPKSYIEALTLFGKVLCRKSLMLLL